MSTSGNYTQQIYTGHKALSLVWEGDDLVDWASGGVRWHPDGTMSPGRVDYAFRFNMAATEPKGEYVVLYSRVGTKGLLLRRGEIVRELNRSCYHAEAFEYPVALVRREDRVLLVHCPSRYHHLEIEDAATGEWLTSRPAQAGPFFHSRLAVSPGGRGLLSAGWVWQPWSAVVCYDLDEALRSPAVLDSLENSAPTTRNVSLAEEDSACWLNDDEVLLAGGDEEDSKDPEVAARGENRLKPHGLAVFHVREKTIRSLCVPEPRGRIGTMMPVGATHVMAFYQYPRLIRLSDGALEFSLPELRSGTQASSIVGGKELPALALDPVRKRFALAQGEKVHVITVG